ncbi:MAG: TetR/AcrR family transcriptional regulator [Solirubrobacterales bacterium]
MSERRRVPKQQRSRDRVDAILAAANEIIIAAGLEELTIREIARRTGIPSSTVYRYFKDRDEIAASFLDREMEAMDLATAEAVLKLKRVSFRSLLAAGMFAHLEYHQAHPAIVPVWFSDSRSPLVSDRIKQMDARTGAWLAEAVEKTGMVAEGAPDYQPDLFTRLGDRALEYILTNGFSIESQNEQMGRYVDMVASYIERFLTERGIVGLPTTEFFAALGDRPSHLEISDPSG